MGLIRRAFERGAEDVRAALAGDPAARSPVEIVLTYPGVHALWAHRLAHGLYRRNRLLSARIVSQTSRFLTGIEIHPGARIGRRVFIDHGMGVVIGETAEIGDDCLLYQGVTLGGTSNTRAKRHPTLRRGVTVGSHASILGPIEVGEGARVGAGSVVIRPVPDEATVIGIPGRVVQPKEHHREPDLDHGRLPDPVTADLRRVLDIERVLVRRMHDVEEKLGIEVDGEPLDAALLELDLFDEGSGI